MPVVHADGSEPACTRLPIDQRHIDAAEVDSSQTIILEGAPKSFDNLVVGTLGPEVTATIPTRGELCGIGNGGQAESCRIHTGSEGTLNTYGADSIDSGPHLDNAPGATPEMARKDGLYRYYEVQDRLVGIHAISPSLEVYFYLDRETGEKFGTLERDQLQYILEELGPFCRRLAFSYGALGGQVKLSPRERETFLFLLGDKSEKEIAAELGLSLRSAHQNVVSVYRKLGFSSRASLMSNWMELQGSSAS